MITLIKRLSLFVLLILSIAITKAEVDLGFARQDAGQPGAFLDFAASARSIGMGRAHVAVADDAGANYWNPAGLTQLERKDVVTLYADLEEDTSFGVLNYAQPTVDWGTLGLSIVALRSQNFDRRNSVGLNTGAFDQEDTAVVLTHGYRYKDWLSMGLGVKLIRQEINDLDDTGFGADLGFMYHFSPKVQYGLTLNNVLAPKLKLKNQSEEYSRSVRAGVRYLPTQRWLVALDVNQTENRSLKPHLGLEWKIRHPLTIRAGINESEMSTGLGFQFGDWTVDYAFGYNDAVPGVEDLGGSHRFGFSLKFGGMVRDEQRSLRWQKKGKNLLAQLRQEMKTDTIVFNKKIEKLIYDTKTVIRRQGYLNPKDLYTAQGYVYFLNGEFERSVQALGEALEFDTENKELKKNQEWALAQLSEERTKEIVALEIKRVRTLYQSNDLKGAIKSSRKILSFRPNHIEAMTYLKDAKRRINEPIKRELNFARIKYDRGDYLAAMTHLLRVKEMDPKNKEAAQYMGHTIGAMKKQASVEFQMNNPKKKRVYPVGKNPDKSRDLYNKGILDYAQGNVKSAIRLWKQAVKLDRNNRLAENAYNRALLEIEER